MNQRTGASERTLHRAGTDAIAASSLAERAAERLDDTEADAFLARSRRHGPDAYVALSRLYADRCDVDTLLLELLQVGLDAAAQRSPSLRRLDRGREADPGGAVSGKTSGRAAAKASGSIRSANVR